MSSSLLENLLGQNFTEAQVQQPSRSAYAKTQEEVKKSCSAQPLQLFGDSWLVGWEWGTVSCHFQASPVVPIYSEYQCFCRTSFFDGREYPQSTEIHVSVYFCIQQKTHHFLNPSQPPPCNTFRPASSLWFAASKPHFLSFQCRNWE